MNRLLLILILTLSFHSLTKADDIRDFEIEGMSVGDSLLDYFSEKEIQKSVKGTRYKDKTYTTANFKIDNSDLFEKLMISYKSNDYNYKIVGVSGYINYKEAHLKCYKKQDKISAELKNLFPNSKTYETRIILLKGIDDGSTTRQDHIELINGDIGVQCKKYGKVLKKKYINHLTVSIFSTDYNYWLVNKAFK